MDAKLTLTIEQTVIEKAKQYASKEGRSLSDMIESYLKLVTREGKSEENVVGKETPVVKSMRGAFKIPEHFDDRDELANALAKKYL